MPNHADLESYLPDQSKHDLIYNNTTGQFIRIPLSQYHDAALGVLAGLNNEALAKIVAKAAQEYIELEYAKATERYDPEYLEKVAKEMRSKRLSAKNAKLKTA